MFSDQDVITNRWKDLPQMIFSETPRSIHPLLVILRRKPASFMYIVEPLSISLVVVSLPVLVLLLLLVGYASFVG